MNEHLTHGWEHDTAPGDSLVRRFVLANSTHSRFVADAIGGRTLLTEEVSAADPASAVFFDNVAILLAPPVYGDLDATLALLAEFYPPQRHWCLLSAWPTPDLRARGFELMGHPPFMVRPAGGSAPPVPDGLEIVTVDTSTQLADFVEVVLASFGMTSGDGIALTDPRILGGPLRLFVGYLDGRPVATAGARIAHGINDIDYVASLAEVRGRGIGGALTWTATLAEPECPATLIASDDGQPVYERMGFLRVMRMTMWHRPPVT